MLLHHFFLASPTCRSSSKNRAGVFRPHERVWVGCLAAEGSERCLDLFFRSVVLVPSFFLMHGWVDNFKSSSVCVSTGKMLFERK